ncbi:MAG: hypothetical protein GC129_03410 [Proteobacteria bacterium]|nr:hypothetical protein [Pseudomonadota bacterium]
MPPKKPAKKPAAKKAVKAKAKPAPKKAARKPATQSKPAAATSFKPAPVTFTPRITAPHAPAFTRVRHTHPFPVAGVAAVTWAYIWRLWLMLLAWGLLSGVTEGLFLGAGSHFSGESVGVALGAANIVISLALGVFTMAWLTRVPRLMGGYSLMLAHPHHHRAYQAFGLWFSYTWRRIAFFIAGLLLAGAVAACVSVISLSFPFVGWVIGVAAIAVGLFYFLALVPYLAWQSVLKKQTFAWGRVELHRLKG